MWYGCSCLSVCIGLVDNSNPTFRPGTWFSVFCLFAIGLFISLGIWQVQRLSWKTALLNQINEKIDQDPIPLPDNLSDPEQYRFSPVEADGKWVPDATIVIIPRTLDGQAGGHIATPLKLKDDRVVMVNRGWIAGDVMKDAGTNLPMAGPVTIHGMIRQWPDEKPRFVPQNNPATDAWHWWDKSAMEKKLDLKLVPVIIYQTGQTSRPMVVAHKPSPDIPNNHRQYAIFWFTMAGITLILWALRGWQKN